MTTIWVQENHHGGYQFYNRREGGNVVAVNKSDAKMVLGIIHDETTGISEALHFGRCPFTIRGKAEQTIIT